MNGQRLNCVPLASILTCCLSLVAEPLRLWERFRQKWHVQFLEEGPDVDRHAQ
jgi:hypothetical protein